MTFRCSFCGKSQDQVQRLIAGCGGVYICDECVALCSEIIEEEQPSATATPQDRAPTSHEAALRDLALALLAPGYEASPSGPAPQLLVGRPPGDLSFPLPLPDGARVVGTWLPGTPGRATIVLATDLSPDAALAWYREQLASAWHRERLPAVAWTEHPVPAHQHGGFVDSKAMRHEFARFILGDSGPGLGLAAYDVPGGRPRLRLDVYPDGAAAFGERDSAPQPAGLDLATVLPTLVPPPGSEQMHPGGSGSNGRMLSNAQLETDLDLVTVAAHYRGQLEQQGWQRGDEGVNGPVAWSSWTLIDGKGARWRGLFVVLNRPDLPRSYSLHLAAESVGRLMS
jgi:hypothetical protein